MPRKTKGHSPSQPAPEAGAAPKGPPGTASPASADLPNSAELLKSYGVTDKHLQEIRAFGKDALSHVGDMVTNFYTWLRTRPEFAQFFFDEAVVERVQGLQRSYWAEFLQAQVNDAYVASRRRVGEVHARINLPLDSYFASMNFMLGGFWDFLKAQRYSAERTAALLDALTRLIHVDTGIVSAAFHHRWNQIITEQSKSLLELSTPVIQLWDKIVLLPIVGIVDTIRASQMIERLLNAIVETEARVAILDVTGVPTVDTLVARHLIKTVSAAKMLGAEVIITGISPETAQTLNTVGVDFSLIKSRGKLRSGVAAAFAIVGKKI